MGWLHLPTGTYRVTPRGDPVSVYAGPRSKFSGFWTRPISIIYAACLDPTRPLSLKSCAITTSSYVVLCVSNSFCVCTAIIMIFWHKYNWLLLWLKWFGDFWLLLGQDPILFAHPKGLFFITWNNFTYYVALSPHYSFSSCWACAQFPASVWQIPSDPNLSPPL